MMTHYSAWVAIIIGLFFHAIIIASKNLCPVTACFYLVTRDLFWCSFSRKKKDKFNGWTLLYGSSTLSFVFRIKWWWLFFSRSTLIQNHKNNINNYNKKRPKKILLFEKSLLLNNALELFLFHHIHFLDNISSPFCLSCHSLSRWYKYMDNSDGQATTRLIFILKNSEFWIE